jgi:hypothetical protein
VPDRRKSCHSCAWLIYRNDWMPADSAVVHACNAQKGRQGGSWQQSMHMCMQSPQHSSLTSGYLQELKHCICSFRPNADSSSSDYDGVNNRTAVNSVHVYWLCFGNQQVGHSIRYCCQSISAFWINPSTYLSPQVVVVAPVHPVSTLLLWGPTAAARTTGSTMHSGMQHRDEDIS